MDMQGKGGSNLVCALPTWPQRCHMNGTMLAILWHHSHAQLLLFLGTSH